LEDAARGHLGVPKESRTRLPINNDEAKTSVDDKTGSAVLLAQKPYNAVDTALKTACSGVTWRFDCSQTASSQ